MRPHSLNDASMLTMIDEPSSQAKPRSTLAIPVEYPQSKQTTMRLSKSAASLHVQSSDSGRRSTWNNIIAFMEGFQNSHDAERRTTVEGYDDDQNTPETCCLCVLFTIIMLSLLTFVIVAEYSGWFRNL